MELDNFKIQIITLSDRASKGEYEDKSGPLAAGLIEDFCKKKGFSYDISSIILPDNSHKLKEIIKKSVSEKIDIIITTGGTGIGPRDITIDTIKPLLDKEIPGIMEMIRVKYGKEKPNALLSRAIAGTINKSLIYTLPGSVKAVKEYMDEIFKTLVHTIYMLHGVDVH
ncbi:MAG: MogA/MoaB family molybdenum cofactor biosynthesis protein [Bacteroidales bacterium]|nr:MogA/MoaB family molybdenum cofactor biosynthesis protein [Bacteroidales bacterium]